MSTTQHRPKGVGHYNAKLTQGQVERIRDEYRQGIVRQADLAARFGMSQRAISMVVRGETYR